MSIDLELYFSVTDFWGFVFQAKPYIVLLLDKHVRTGLGMLD